MAATPVPSFSAPPDFPALSDRALGTYNSKAYAWATAWQGTTGPNVHAIAATAYANAQEAATQAASAVGASAQAVGAADAAVASSNFKGAWSALTGALSMPASVLHSGQYWLLLQPLLDVAASEPGLDAASWSPLVDLRDNVVPATGGSMDCAAGDYFTITVAGAVTLSFANVPSKAYSCVLEIEHTSGAITVPSGAVWANGKVPEFVTGRRHLLFFHRAHTGSGGWIMSALEGSAA